MPRNQQAVKLQKLVQAKDTVSKCEAQLAQARLMANKAAAACAEAGISLSEMARVWGTSPQRMKDRVQAGKFAAEAQD